ncbi:MAG: hypothetical protein ACE5E2_02440 [Candidatus Binatia bacterium]
MLLWRQTTEKEQFLEPELAQPSWQQKSENQEPVIFPGFIIERKIEGMGHVRIARRFLGDVHIDGPQEMLRCERERQSSTGGWIGRRSDLRVDDLFAFCLTLNKALFTIIRMVHS